jgi:uncharacterized membrane protein
MGQPTSQRDYGIDALRGVAIVAMVASHLAREILAEPHPLWLRVYGSVAAPLFITLAGMMVAQTSQLKHYPVGHYLSRGGLVMLLAALVDVLLWGIYPFIGFDVLYLIGVAVPLTALFGRLSPAWQTGLLVLVLGLSGLLRNLWGYPETVLTLLLGESPRELFSQGTTVLQQWLVAGWFPLFPWVFFSFLGVRLFQWRQASSKTFRWHVLRVGAPLIGLGLFCGWLAPTPPIVRSGYSELFYPPSVAFVLIASGMVLTIFSTANLAWMNTNRPLILLGQCSLLIYVGHLAIIHWGLQPLFPEVYLPLYLVLYLALLLVLTGVAGAVELFKRRSERRLPFMLRFLLGG